MIIAAKTRISGIWNFLKGGREFPLQSRIYHSVCIVTILVITYNVFFCLALGSYREALASLLLLAFQLFLYYLSRFRRRSLRSMVVYSLLIHVFFAVNFYNTSGTQGAALLSFAIAYFLIIATVPKKQYWFWTIGNIALVLSLIMYEYHHPGIIFNQYPSRSARLMDMASTYVITIVLTFCSLSYIINNYAFEKRVAEENTAVLKSLNDEKNKLISIISHDFSSPLTNIQRYLNILAKVDLSAQDRQMLHADLQRVTTDTQELLNNLLSWTKKQLQYTDTSLSMVNVLDATANSVEVLKNQAALKGIGFDFHIGPEVEVYVNGAMFDIVMRNLMNNAVKFTQPGGAVRVSSEKRGDSYIFMIRDNGPGIPADVQKDVFSIDIKSTYGTGNEKGVGLGLAICKEFADAQKGRLWFETRAGEGTVFYLEVGGWRTEVGGLRSEVGGLRSEVGGRGGI